MPEWIVQPLERCSHLASRLKQVEFYCFRLDEDGEEVVSTECVDMTGIKPLYKNESLCKRLLRVLFPARTKTQFEIYRSPGNTTWMLEFTSTLQVLQKGARIAIVCFAAPDDFLVGNFEFDPDPKRLAPVDNEDTRHFVELWMTSELEDVPAVDADELAVRSEQAAERTLALQHAGEGKLPESVLQLIGALEAEDVPTSHHTSLSDTMVTRPFKRSALGEQLYNYSMGRNGVNNDNNWWDIRTPQGQHLSFHMKRYSDDESEEDDEILAVSLREFALDFRIAHVPVTGAVHRKAWVLLDAMASAFSDSRPLAEDPVAILRMFAAELPAVAISLSGGNFARIHVPRLGACRFDNVDVPVLLETILWHPERLARPFGFRVSANRAPLSFWEPIVASTARVDQVVGDWKARLEVWKKKSLVATKAAIQRALQTNRDRVNEQRRVLKKRFPKIPEFNRSRPSYDKDAVIGERETFSELLLRWTQKGRCDLVEIALKTTLANLPESEGFAWELTRF